MNEVILQLRGNIDFIPAQHLFGGEDGTGLRIKHFSYDGSNNNTTGQGNAPVKLP
ncbi:MAG: hypothetical protein ABI165_13905 [Bryobacteraceae bacterium]